MIKRLSAELSSVYRFKLLTIPNLTTHLEINDLEQLFWTEGGWRIRRDENSSHTSTNKTLTNSHIYGTSITSPTPAPTHLYQYLTYCPMRLASAPCSCDIPSLVFMPRRGIKLGLTFKKVC